MADAQTFVGGASIRGTFNAATWQSVSTGAWIETGRFLDMTANAASTLQAMNIPSVLVGSATLSQESGTTINSLSNVTLANVGFFAYATGGTPRIWATAG